MRRFRSCESGQALVEFALFMPLFLIILVGAVDVKGRTTAQPPATKPMFRGWSDGQLMRPTG
jgi:hypothetical protein